MRNNHPPDPEAPRPTPPTGTVTFLFTDIEGSTRLWQQFPGAMKDALARHHDLLRLAIEAHGGYIFQIVGDAFCASFRTALAGVTAALAAQHALLHEPWGETGPLRVRMALHTGTADVHAGAYRSGEYESGLTLSRAARLLSAGHGGQILLSHTTQELARDHLPPPVELRDLGERRLRDLVRPEHIFQVLDPALPSTFPPLKSLDLFPNNLPSQLTSFVGREREVQEVKRLLSESRLLTLVGPGGTGKTRISLQIAGDLLDTFPDGLWLIELAPLSDSALVPQAVASAVGVREDAGRPLAATLADELSRRHMLLILDNCEHVVEASAQLAEALLRVGPKLKILTTSREALGVTGEVVFRVPSLSLPDTAQLPPLDSLAKYEAVRLLVDRATAVLPSFTVTTANAAALVEICQRLDGIPLAIELAAARLKALSAAQIASHLHERFRLLTAGSRTALRRHQTLRGSIDWSYDLLADSERALLRRLSVFAGGWTLAAAEVVGTGHEVASAEVLDLLGRLVDKSLVMADEAGSETRYRLLESIRQYGREKLRETAEEEIARDRHRAFYLTLAEQADARLQGPEQAGWLRRLEIEHDNLRAALRSSLEADSEQSLRFGASLWLFWDTRGHVSEGRAWLEEILAKTRERPAAQLTPTLRHARVRTLDGAARMLLRQSELARAKEIYIESVASWRELEDRSGLAEALNNLGDLTRQLGDRVHAKILVEESLTLFRQAADKRGISHALNNLADIVMAEGNWAQAKRLFAESVPLFREIADKRGLAHGLNNLGGLLTRERDYLVAETLYRESLGLAEDLDDKHAIATAQRSLGDVARHRGHYTEAMELYQQSLDRFLQMSDKYCAGKSLTAFGWAAHDAGDVAKAKRLSEQSVAIFRELNVDPDIALALRLLGSVALAEDQAEQASELFLESLVLHRNLQNMAGITTNLEDLARVARARGQAERLVQLLAAAEAVRAAHAVSLAPLDRDAYESAVAHARSGLDETAFAAAWAKGAALTLEQAMTLASEMRYPP